MQCTGIQVLTERGRNVQEVMVMAFCCYLLFSTPFWSFFSFSISLLVNWLLFLLFIMAGGG